MSRIRPPRPSCLEKLGRLLIYGEDVEIRKVFISSQADVALAYFDPGNGDGDVGDTVGVEGVSTLDKLLRKLWPDLFEASNTYPAG